MKYWFRPGTFRSDSEYLNSSGELKTIKIKKDTFEKAEKIARFLTIQTNLSSLRPYWTTINTFGWIFCDFEPERTGNALMGSGARRLSDLTKNDFKYIVLTTKIGDNVIPLPEKETLIVNILFFKEFISTFTNPHKRVELFLYKFPESELEIIKRWIRGLPENIQKEDRKMIATDIISLIKDNEEFFNSQGNTDITLNLIKKSYIIKNHKRMTEDLEKFKDMVDKDSSELDINDFLVKRPWIISFDYSFLKSERRDMFDMHIFDKKWNTGKDIVVELKRANKKTTKKYSSHEVISSDTAVAISQCINYIEENKELFERGIVILGKENSQAVERMNKYLHNIDLLTYNKIYEKAKKVLNFLEKQYLKVDPLETEEENATTKTN